MRSPKCSTVHLCLHVATGPGRNFLTGIYQYSLNAYRVGQKVGQRLVAIILSNLNKFNFFTGRFLGKFVVKWVLKITPNLAYVAILPCEILMSAKQAINDKLQGSVATYLRCAGVINN